MSFLAGWWGAARHALVGLPLGLGGAATIAGSVIVWVAAVWSLVDGPTGGWDLAVAYAVVAVVGPVLVPRFVWWFGALQRVRFRAVLGIEIPAPARRAGRWPTRLWLDPATWRQLVYHVLAAGIGTVGVVLLPAAVWVSTVDESTARRLLGPSHGEEQARRIESLARSRADIVAATDAERRRIERDLHDGAQQRLVSLAMNLGMARASLTDAPEPARQAIEQAHDEAVRALAELREFVRGLHPAVLNDRGLDAALSGIAARAPVPVRLRVEARARCAPSIEAVAYFVVSEALTNVARHAHASRADVTVSRRNDRLRVEVRDDGRGGAVIGDSGSGLRGLAQRAAAVDGTFTVDSPSGGPTTVTAELPCGS